MVASSRFLPERTAGLLFVVALHAAALWGLWQHRLLPDAREAVTLFVNFITPPPPKKREEPKPPPPPKPKPVEKPQPRQIVAETPVVAPTEYVAPPPPPPAKVVEAPPAPPAPPRPVGPVTLGGDLAVVCPERTPPRYPHHSRRLGEAGTVVLRVELDEHGAVSMASVSASSGFARLDNAALEAVRGWRCHPARRDGQPVRAIAMQPFNFVLQGS
jgi:protein TonB